MSYIWYWWVVSECSIEPPPVPIGIVERPLYNHAIHIITLMHDPKIQHISLICLPPIVGSWNSKNSSLTNRTTRHDFPTAVSPNNTSLKWHTLLLMVFAGWLCFSVVIVLAELFYEPSWVILPAVPTRGGSCFIQYRFTLIYSFAILKRAGN